MRKAQKQDILEMIQTLHEAHEEIKGYIDKKNYALAQDILSQCQECAISIGTAIEKFEGEGFVTISYVESYCDVVFHCYEELSGSEVNANKIYKNLKKQLLRIESSVKNDVPIRKEIAFFPYKASMWDALESVYLAAKEDPDCDAYCVPIPYYDRNSDRSLGQMHYEGREYPKNIEVIDWQTYNFEERKPDVVYIHNPYDDWNLVTCVHPRYFTKNLKKYVDKLIYIPYFVLDEIEPDDQERIDGMKHFIWTPGVINADKVIVQSEKMKQIYVNEYLKAAQANGLQGKHIDRKYLEEKFQGLGSPKFDKVLNTKKEDLEIPQEWLKIIEKPDGSWKKIIFYNTSIGALLQYNEKMLEKMKDVFRIFKENRDEVAMLWRPHPLIKTTVSSMRPQLWVEYEKLVNWYCQEGWGIYDDTADMDRAVVLSDAYYGDHSSVVQLYQKTGKLVMIQDVEITNHFSRVSVSAMGALIDGNECWLPSAEINGLFYGKIVENREIKCTRHHEFQGINGIDAFKIRSVIDTGKDIYLFSLFDSNCWKYNKNEKNIIKESYTSKKYNRIANVEKVGNNIWILPCKYENAIICYDYVNKKSTEIDWSSDIYINADKNTTTRSVVYGDCIYFCTRVPNKILLYRLDCKNKSIYTYKIENVEYVNCLTVCNDNLWILGKNDASESVLLKLDLKDLSIIQDIILLGKIELEKSSRLTYFKMISFEGKIFLIPAYGKYLFVFDTETRTEKIIDYPKEIQNKYCLFYETQQQHNLLYLFPYKSDLLLTLDMRNAEISKRQVVAEIQDYIKSDMQTVKFEGENVSLNLLIQNELVKSNNVYDYERYGNKIYDEMRNVYER